jgi:FdhE protein
MPYVALEPVARQSRMAAATARWSAILAARPDLGPAVALQQHLIDILVERLDALEQTRLPRLSLPARYLAAKLVRGVPALAGEQIPIPTAALKPALLRLSETLSHGGAAEPAIHVAATVRDGAIDAGSLLAASQARDQNGIRTAAVHHGLAPDLLWLIAELAVSPFTHLLQRTLFAASPPSAEHGQPGPLHEALATWDRGYCPACGSWPALAELVNGARLLRCSFCGSAWTLLHPACAYCGENGPAFVSGSRDEKRPDLRLDRCDTCRGYLKTVSAREPSPFPLVAIADLETMDLDVAAMDRGYHRPPLKDFTRGG